MAKAKIPADLRGRLENARLDARALFRALDRLDITREEMPQDLIHELFELDADCAEALWALDQPPRSLNLTAMVRDTLESLENIPVVRNEFLAKIPERSKAPLVSIEKQIRSELSLDHAYIQVPGRDPEVG
jgi:hypothetical protein